MKDCPGELQGEPAEAAFGSLESMKEIRKNDD